MKKVTIKKMHLVNWRGAKDVEISFDSIVTHIHGGNGTGKSTLFEAFLWCLFGKDSQGRTDFEVKRTVDGESLRKVDAEVEIILDVDGSDITLKRVLHEKWGKPRGQVEEVFRGNETLCFVNDVPLKVGEYKSKVDDIIDERQFKLLTNPDFFLNLDWNTQREILFSIAGTKRDEEIAKGNDDFESLLILLKDKSLSEYKKELVSKKNKAREELNSIQPRIDEAERLKPEELDWVELETKWSELQETKQKLQESLNDESVKLQNHLEEKRACEQDIDSIKREIYQLEQEVQAQDDKRYHEANKKFLELQEEIENKVHEVKKLTDKQNSLLSFIDTNGQQIASYQARVEAYRQDWLMENAKEYNGDKNCPTCHQPLPLEMVEESRKLFNDTKSQKLKDIQELGDNANNVINDLNKRNQEVTKEADELKKLITSIEADVASMRSELDTMKKPSRKETALTTVEDYNLLCDKLLKKQVELQKLRDMDGDLASNEDVKAQIEEIEKEISNVKKLLDTKQTIDKHNVRIKELNEQSKELAQLVASYEKSEMIVQKFTKAKIEDTETRINSLFSMLTFQLFSYTQDGNEVETCIPRVDGVVYGVANTANKVNAGIDVINTFSKHFNKTAPIWLDNAERINDVIPTESQLIKLSVSTAKELTIID